MSQSKVSVIMPVYNTKQWVWEAIESILNQTFEDFEFIIIDDYSSDGSYEICKKYAEKDKRIKLYKNEKNKWISFTRNKLIELASTDYITTQDSDDISIKNRIELEYNFLLNNPNYSVVWWNCEIIDKNGEKIWLRKYSDDISSVIMKKSPLSNPSTMFRKSLFKKVWWYEKWLNYGEDYDLWLRFYLNWYGIKNLDQTLLKYRLREWQTKSTKLKETLKNTIKLQKKYIKLWIKTSFSDKIYLLCENILLLLPSKFIDFLFKKITYKKS
jgi:glycosyltransferase involved in cell wall biosynthesis